MTMFVNGVDESSALEHYGVKGMKWGVRKDQRAAKKAEKAKQAQVKKFNSRYKQGWVKAYNKAADKNEKNIAEINEKYKKHDFSKVDPAGNNKGVDTKTKKAWNNYVQEQADAWRKTYSDVLLSEIGEHPEVGKAWVKEAPFMDSFSGYKIDED